MADDPTIRKRLAAAVSYATISGVWIYASHKEVGAFHTDAAAVCVLVLGVAVGAYVRSWWMLLSLVGPLIALGYLEVSGFVGSSDDWASEPLLSPPGVFVFFIFTMILMIGYALGQGAEWVAGVWRRRDRDEESKRW
jgi:hypothetical protein